MGPEQERELRKRLQAKGFAGDALDKAVESWDLMEKMVADGLDEKMKSPPLTIESLDRIVHVAKPYPSGPPKMVAFMVRGGREETHAPDGVEEVLLDLAVETYFRFEGLSPALKAAVQDFFGVDRGPIPGHQELIEHSFGVGPGTGRKPVPLGFTAPNPNGPPGMLVRPIGGLSFFTGTQYEVKLTEREVADRLGDMGPDGFQTWLVGIQKHTYQQALRDGYFDSGITRAPIRVSSLDDPEAERMRRSVQRDLESQGKVPDGAKGNLGAQMAHEAMWESHRQTQGRKPRGMDDPVSDDVRRAMAAQPSPKPPAQELKCIRCGLPATTVNPDGICPSCRGQRQKLQEAAKAEAVGVLARGLLWLLERKSPRPGEQLERAGIIDAIKGLLK